MVPNQTAQIGQAKISQAEIEYRNASLTGDPSDDGSDKDRVYPDLEGNEPEFHLLFPIPKFTAEEEELACQAAQAGGFDSLQDYLDAYNEWQLNAFESQTPE
jgi:hypothetical protein